jgi:hypothetical protein
MPHCAAPIVKVSAEEGADRCLTFDYGVRAGLDGGIVIK